MGTNYYARLPACDHPCDHCAKAIEVHLGKSSGGWRFLHRAYPEDYERPAGLDFPVTDRASWLKLLELGPILSECGEEIDRAEFLQVIEDKQGGIRHDASDPRARAAGFWGRNPQDFVSEGYDFCGGEFS